MSKVGMAVGSLMAISTCALAVFGESGLPEVPEFMAEDQMFEVARGLKAIGNDEQEPDDVWDTNVLPQRLKNSTWGKVIENVLDAKDDTDIVRYYDDGTKMYPCFQNNPRKFLETYYKVESLREDYLDKQIKTHCAQ